MQFNPTGLKYEMRHCPNCESTRMHCGPHKANLCMNCRPLPKDAFNRVKLGLVRDMEYQEARESVVA